MTLRKKLALAGGTAVLGVALAGLAPAEASPAPSTQAAGWHQIFSGTHGPANKWSTGDFVPDRSGFSAHFGCYGHDGAKVQAELVRTRDKKVVKRSGAEFCQDGATRYLNTSVTPGTSYYLRLHFTKGPKHSVYARAFDKH